LPPGHVFLGEIPEPASEKRRHRCEPQGGARLIVNSDDFRDNGAHRHAVKGFQRPRDRVADFPVFKSLDQAAAGRPIYRRYFAVIDNESKLLIRLKFTPVSAPIFMIAGR
jgi:hypothetical protein